MKTIYTTMPGYIDKHAAMVQLKYRIIAAIKSATDINTIEEVILEHYDRFCTETKSCFNYSTEMLSLIWFDMLVAIAEHENWNDRLFHTPRGVERWTLCADDIDYNISIIATAGVHETFVIKFRLYIFPCKHDCDINDPEARCFIKFNRIE